ncbi:MAG: MAPEG family protein [Alteraurantiacibacter sp.]
MFDLHITLLSAGLAAFINIWLAIRCGRARMRGKVAHGDGGDALLGRAMRAHANFTEYTPLFLILVAALELTGHGGWPLGVGAGLFLAGRIFHAVGMDAEVPGYARTVGVLCTIPTLLALGVAATLTGLKLF